MRLFAVVFLISLQSWALDECQTKLIKILRRASPPATTHVYNVEAVKPENRLPSDNILVQKLIKPELEADRDEMGAFKFNLISRADFEANKDKLSDKGIWLFYSPSPRHAKIQSGHFSSRVKDTYFARDIEMAYPQGILEGKTIDRLWIDEEPYYLAQYMELSDASINALHNYFHTRVLKHKTDPDFKTTYVDLPFSHNKDVADGENCTTFLFTPYVARWLQKFPELEQVHKELGSLSVSDQPYRQIHFNTQSQAYRGSVMIVKDPTSFEASLLDGSFNKTSEGLQMFINGNVKKIIP